MMPTIVMLTKGNRSESASLRSVSIGRQSLVHMQSESALGSRRIAGNETPTMDGDGFQQDHGKMEEVRLKMIRRNHNTIESLIGNPICCGYLLRFCESQFNSENLNFLLEVDEFRDSFAVDIDVWLDTWREVDERVNFDHDEDDAELMDEKWPSLADRASTFAHINRIVDRFITNNAPEQVCISETFINKLMKRIKLFHLYGPEVFEEACLDPIKTMRKDISPRFCRSPLFETMIQRLASCDPPPPAVALHVPMPDDVTLLASGTLDDFPESRSFTLNEVINSAVCYPVFLEYLVGVVSTENLLCVRMIDKFEQLMSIAEGRSSGDTMTVDTSAGTSAGTSIATSKSSSTTILDEKTLEAATEQAWEIYRFFVTPGASFEVSIHHLLRKHIMLHMGNLKSLMFEYVRRSAYDMLKVNFEDFKKSSGYQDRLGKLVRAAKVKYDATQVHRNNDQTGGDAGFSDGTSTKAKKKPASTVVPDPKLKEPSCFDFFSRRK